MSGHRWSSLLCFCSILALIGCQSDESGKRAWNPFRRATAQAESSKDESPFSLPGFPKKNADELKSASATSDFDTPVAEEQVEQLLADGQLALQEDRLQDARRAYTQVLTYSPDNATAHHGLAMAADLTQQWADAEYHYRQALRIHPRDANLLCDIGYSYLLQNRYSEASRYLNHAVEINPQHESAQMNLALLDLRQGNRSAAQNRITARFGISAEAAQVMAQLESQTGVDAASFTTEAKTEPLANSTFEQVQELARQERIEAERRRASQGTPLAPQTGTDEPQRVAVLLNQLPPGPGSAYAPNAVAQSNAVAAANPVNASAPLGNGTLWAQSSGITPPALPLQAAANSALPNSPPNGVQPNYNQLPISIYPPGVGNSSHANVTLPAASSTGAAANLSQLPVGYPQPQVNSFFQPANPAPPVMNGSPNYSGAPASAMAASSSPPGAAPVLSAPNLSVNNGPSNNSASNNSASGRIVPVHASGTFQTPNVGSVSYGQPLGFQPGSSGTGPASPFNVNNSGIANPAQMNPGFSAAPIATNSLNPPVMNASQPIYLDGLNAGPGTMFPIGQSPDQRSNTPQPGAANSNPLPNPAPQINMNNVSSPGTNSLLNGALYAQPDSSLPAQEWANQQQQQLRAQQLQSQLWQNQQRQGSSGAPVSAPINPSGPAPFPSRPAPINPLEAYERQRLQLDTEYNKTLQQMDQKNGRQVPQFP